METWSTHHLYKKAKHKFSLEIVSDIQKKYNALQNSNLPVIFTLRHLSKIIDTDYEFLHNSVNRQLESSNYRLFSITKRSGGKRFIHSVSKKLIVLHKYINSQILQMVPPHHCCYAFHSKGGIKKCANSHCGCNWLLQFDLKDFFYSISECDVYLLFRKLGYKSLLSFELARLCTTLHLPKSHSNYIKIGNSRSDHDKFFISPQTQFPYNYVSKIGVLPQGAPASPMLSNLIAFDLDVALYSFAQEFGFVYSRYADDISFSSTVLPKGKSLGKLRNIIVSIIRRNGFIENSSKIRIAGPGARKEVLGLVVDGEQPRISKFLFKRIDRALYAAKKFGLKNVADHDGFDSVYGFYNHLAGLMAYIKDVHYGNVLVLPK
jgi:RNA-directed DNA polymerase